MNKVLFALLLVVFTVYGRQQERVAIINTMDNLDSISFSDLSYFTNKLREAAVNVLPNSLYGVMTTESIIAFLGSQENAIKVCKEASCLAELGRKVSADYVAQGRIGRFNGELTINVELYNSKSGNLIGSFAGSSKDIAGLLTIINENAPVLFKKLPDVSGGGSPFVANYELGGGKRYLVNLSTEPPGAVLSFNGVPSPNCPKTPCKIELGKGNVRIIAALEQHEVVDTTISVSRNNQNVDIRLRYNFGILDIKPAYLDGIGEEEDWNLYINGKEYGSFENKFSPGSYDVKLSHKCYETISFMAGISKGSHEVFDMAGNIKLKKGGLDLSAERNGVLVAEPVFVNRVQVGETPFSDAIPLCSEIEIGENRERVYVTLKHNEVVKHTHRGDFYDAPATYVPTPEQEKPVKTSFWVALGLDVVGATVILAGIVANQDVKEKYERYEERGQSHEYYKSARKDVESSRSSRNTLYTVGSLMLASGIGVHIWF